MAIPENLVSLHNLESELRTRAITIIDGNAEFQLHLALVEAAMGLANVYRQFETEDQDLKVTQVLGMRGFNAFGASLNLALAGYSQNAALIQRDILETVFLLDLFSSDRNLITRWRNATHQERMREFSPVKVRERLDERDGLKNKKRFEIYEMLSILAAHPNMNSTLMMRPEKGGDIFIGPFIEETTLDAVLSEKGRLALQFGEHIEAFLPDDWGRCMATRQEFTIRKRKWMRLYRSKLAARKSAPDPGGAVSSMSESEPYSA